MFQANASWCGYPKIWNLGHPKIRTIFNEPVLVEEKIDGSQFSFGVFGGELKCKSKGKLIILDYPEKMFKKAVETVLSLKDKLRDGWTYRGEYLSKPKHNCLCYDRVPDNHIIIFDINTDYETYLDYQLMRIEAERLGFEVVPSFGIMRIKSPEEFLKLLETTSILGGQTIEGVVCKSYSQFGRDGKALMCKYVSEKFKEKHTNDWKKANPGRNDLIQALGMEYRSEARWEKAIIHLKERGELEDSPTDIGKLLKEVHKDLDTEARDEIAEKIMASIMPKIKRASTAGLPEWYKEKLIEEQFKGEDNE